MSFGALSNRPLTLNFFSITRFNSIAFDLIIIHALLIIIYHANYVILHPANDRFTWHGITYHNFAF